MRLKIFRGKGRGGVVLCGGEITLSCGWMMLLSRRSRGLWREWGNGISSHMLAKEYCICMVHDYDYDVL